MVSFELGKEIKKDMILVISGLLNICKYIFETAIIAIIAQWTETSQSL